jgi:hypothetical protein
MQVIVTIEIIVMEICHFGWIDTTHHHCDIFEDKALHAAYGYLLMDPLH